MMAEQITEDDEEALKFLQNIAVTFHEDMVVCAFLAHHHADPCADQWDSKQGFDLTFTFAENPFFTNKTLTKKYIMKKAEEDTHHDLVFDHAEGEEIKWNKDKALTHTVETKKQRHKCIPSFLAFRIIVPHAKQCI